MVSKIVIFGEKGCDWQKQQLQVAVVVEDSRIVRRIQSTLEDADLKEADKLCTRRSRPSPLSGPLN